MAERLFVYGSLRKGADFEKARLLEGGARHLGAASAAGRLYLIDWYPGMVASDDPGDRVKGDVFALDDPALLAVLDAYEGCGPDDPHPREYRRERLEIRMGGKGLLAWAYWYNRPVTGFPVIEDGDFLAVQELPPPRER